MGGVKLKQQHNQKKKAVSGNRGKSSDQSSKWIFWSIGIIAVLVVAYLFLMPKSTQMVLMEAADYEGQPYLGKETAKVKIVEFGDYKCPACKTFNEELVKQIDKDYVETGVAQFYFFQDPFISVDSHRSALFAETVFGELGNDSFWKFHDLLYKNLPADLSLEKKDYFTEDMLKSLLGQMADAQQTEKVMQAFAAKKYQAAVDKDLAIVKKLDVRGTPTLYINGKRFEGNSMDDFKKAVEEAANPVAEGK
ncbi:thiol-disulfide oxidoreductase [Brevibacillus laterosporus]|nr:thiol-disulfide oxidoreductase [Brevibacillus laterosporus]TPG85024.1 thiol-disulfide oxidoreductase [Brevibacillus laterosporus]